jgi:hypothetical protein
MGPSEIAMDWHYIPVLKTWLQSVSFLILLLLVSFPSQADIFLNGNDMFWVYKLLFSIPKLFRKKKSFLRYDRTPGSFEWRWITQPRCSWLSPQWLLVSPRSNHVISGLFSIIWHWQPFQNIGDLQGEGRCGFTRTYGHTATEHEQKYIPGTWSFQQTW